MHGLGPALPTGYSHENSEKEAKLMKQGSGYTRRVTLVLIIIGLVAASQLWLVQIAFAHGDLARADPSPNSVLEQAPDRVVIWFTEPMEPDFSEIQVLDARGERVDNGDSLVDSSAPTALSVTLAPLPNGTYTVAWKNVSTIDGHRVRGSFVFSVGEPIDQALLSGTMGQPLLQSPLEPLARWLALLSALAMVGGLGFEELVWRPALARRRPTKALQRLGKRLASRMLKLTWIAMGLFLAASVLHLLVQTSLSYELPLYRVVGGPLTSVLSRTGWGHLWLSRIRWLLIVGAALGLLFTLPSREQDGDGQVVSYHRLFRAVALWAGAGMLLSLSQASHGAATAGIRTAAIFTDFLHLLAASFWVGGLFHFALGVPMISQALSGGQRRDLLADLVPRFSTLAMLSVGTLVITGLYSTWAQVTILPALATPYGLTLLAKLGLLVPLLLLGAANLLWVSPRLAKEDGAGRWLRRFVAGEVILAGLVLLAVGLLTSLEPARQVASREGLGPKQSLTFQDSVEGADITLDVEPGLVGPNTFRVMLKDRRGRPIANASDVRLRLTYLDTDLGDTTAPAVSEGEGRYVVEDGLLSIAGPWQAELVVRRPDAFDARTAFRFEVDSGGPTGGAAIAPAPETGKRLWGAELVLLGFLFLVASIPHGGWKTRAGAVIMGPGVVSVLVGLFLVMNVQFGGAGVQAGAEKASGNPFPPNAQSLEVGRQAYEQNCQSCHGANGRGDGPAAAGLNPPPADLVVHVPLHSETDLFRMISYGIPGTGMPPMEERLSTDEIWHVINFIRTLEE